MEYVAPSGSHKVPSQRLSDRVTSDVSDGRCGVLLTDLLWVQTIVQIPEITGSVDGCQTCNTETLQWPYFVSTALCLNDKSLIFKKGHRGSFHFRGCCRLQNPLEMSKT